MARPRRAHTRRIVGKDGAIKIVQVRPGGTPRVKKFGFPRRKATFRRVR